MRNILLILFLLLPSFMSAAQTIINGVVSDEKGEPVIGANVYVEDSYDGATTDLNGAFSFETIENGSRILIVSFIGFETRMLSIDLPSSDNINIKVVLKEKIDRLNAVVISAGAYSAGEESNREVLKPLDIVTTAGATADVAGALNTLPGTQTVGETGRLFVRGGDGYETRTFIDGLEVLNSYSPSAPNTPGRGRFSPFMFSGTSFSTGGYSAEYGQALSSALILNTKDIPAQNRTDLSIMSVGGDVAHTQLFDRSSISAKLQYTNLSPYFELIKQEIDFEKSPQAIDGNVAYRHKVGENGLIKLYGNASNSRFDLYQSDILDPSLKNKVELSNAYVYGNLSYKDILNDKWTIKSGFAITSSDETVMQNTKMYEGKIKGTHTKLTFNYDQSEKLVISFGSEHFLHRYSNFNSDYGSLDVEKHLFGSYLEADYYLSNNLLVRGGGRLEYNDLQDKVYVVPRASLAYRIGDDGQFSVAYGKFNQSAQSDHLLMQQEIEDEISQHFILNYQVIKNGRTFRAEVYHKNYVDLVKFTDQFNGGTFNNKGSGFARGIDVFWRDNETFEGVDYWVSYSFLDSERDYLNYPYKTTPSFSSEHNFSYVMKYFIKDIKTQIGVTYSYSSPRSYNNPNDEEFNAGKTPSYHDLSANFSYLMKSNVIIHGSVTNILGIENIFGYEYSNERDSSGVFVSRPIKQQAPRFIFLGVFITLSKEKSINQMPNL